MKGKNNTGFTLIELMIVIGMLTIVLASIYSLYQTHERAAYTQEDVVEVQQNLRTALDSIERDVRMAGFLIPIGTYPVSSVLNDVGVLNSDFLTLNMASAPGKYARVSVTQFVNSLDLTVESSDAVDAFNTGDLVRIMRPSNRAEPTGGTVFQVLASPDTDRTVPQIGLQYVTGADPTTTLFNAGDVIFATTSPGPGYVHPNTVMYCLGPAAAVAGVSPDCGSAVTNCPTNTAQTKCLMRVENGTANVIATNITSLQFRYLQDFGTEGDIPTDFSLIRGVRATLSGQTVATVALSDYVPKVRTITSVIKIRNR
jgi:prepilin-type N-terminal cleavage/methylation domain-containing protein